MTKILTTRERIKSKRVFDKYFDVVKHMTLKEFDHFLSANQRELEKHYNICQWRGEANSRSITDYEMGVANLLADRENVSLTNYKRLFGI